MKKTIRANERGETLIDWLESYHTFSFGEFYDKDQMGYKSLRVLNDDTISAGGGFGMHPHKNMEIFSYVPQGKLEHKDSLGNHGYVGKGRAQLISAGKGILHSEFNPSNEESTHLIQIWIQPKVNNTEPQYFERELVQNDRNFKLLLSPDGIDGSMPVKQDVWLYNVRPGKKKITLPLPDKENLGRAGYLFIVEGVVAVDGETYQRGDSLEFDHNVDLVSESERTDLLWFVFKN